MKAVTDITVAELSDMAAAMYGNLVKGVVDVQRQIREQITALLERIVKP